MQAVDDGGLEPQLGAVGVAENHDAAGGHAHGEHGGDDAEVLLIDKALVGQLSHATQGRCEGVVRGRGRLGNEPLA